MYSKHRVLALALALLLSLVLAACSPPADAVALVNGEPITRDELDSQMDEMKEFYEMQGIDLDSEEGEEMRAEMEEQLLEDLISQQLVLQAAEAGGFAAEDEEVDAEVQTVKDQFETEEEFTEALAEQDLTEEDFRGQVEEQLVIRAYFEAEMEERETEITEEELEERYQDYLEGQPEDEEPASFEEMKDQLEQMAEQEQMQKISEELLEELREDAEIEILL